MYRVFPLRWEKGYETPSCGGEKGSETPLFPRSEHEERGSLRPFSPSQEGVSDPFSHRKRGNLVHPQIPLAKIPLRNASGERYDVCARGAGRVRTVTQVRLPPSCSWSIKHVQHLHDRVGHLRCSGVAERKCRNYRSGFYRFGGWHFFQT